MTLCFKGQVRRSALRAKLLLVVVQKSRVVPSMGAAYGSLVLGETLRMCSFRGLSDNYPSCRGNIIRIISQSEMSLIQLEKK